MSKVLVIGLDGATWDLLKPWIEEGHIKNMAKLIKDGVSGNLQSTIPPLSCPAWLSFMTGKNPGKLGIYDFLIYNPNDYSIRPVNTKSLEGKAIWDIISDEGISVGVVNVPMTTPHSLNGFIVSGMFTPNEDDFVYPHELKSKLNEVTDQYELDISQFDYSDEDQFIEGVYKVLDKRKKAVEYLMDTRDWDFFMVVFTTPDRMQHFLWKHMDQKHPLHDPDKAEKYKDAIKDFWQRLDQIVGELVKKAGNETNVIVISDHGFGTQDMVFYVNDWLKEQGYLRLKQRETSFFAKLGLNSENISIVLKRLRLYDFVMPFVPMKIRNLVPSKSTSFDRMKDNIDWKHTKAYSAPHSFACEQIYINLKGREPHGSVGLEEYESTRDEIMEQLKRLIDPQTNEQMRVEVFKPEEIYSGAYVDLAPDIIYFIEGLRCISDKNFGHQSIFERTSINSRQNASHRMAGVFIAHGSDIKIGAEIQNAKIYDIAPTVLHMLSLPIPDDMDGRVLKDIFKEGSESAQREVRYQVVDMGKEKVKDRIRKLKKSGKL